VDSAKTITAIVSHTLQSGHATNEVTKQAEDDWLALLSTGMGMIIGGTDCTPGYYNNEGQGWEGTPAALGTGYPAGAVAYFNYIDAWRNSGKFEGLAFA
jgi:cyclohexanone monooxygenase